MTDPDPLASPLPAAALFDLDGTLVDREPLMLEAACRVLADAGRPLSRSDLGWAIGRAWQDVYEQLGVAGDPGLDLGQFLDRVVAEGARLADAGFPVREITGGRQLIERLSAAGVAVAVVTGSTRAEAEDALARMGVRSTLRVVVGAEDYGPGKPDPSCYRLAAQILDVPAPRCVVFEDSWAGLTAGRAAGMRTVAVAEANAPAGDPGHQDLSVADAVVTTHDEVTDELLAGLLGR